MPTPEPGPFTFGELLGRDQLILEQGDATLQGARLDRGLGNVQLSKDALAGCQLVCSISDADSARIADVFGVLA